MAPSRAAALHITQHRCVFNKPPAFKAALEEEPCLPACTLDIAPELQSIGRHCGADGYGAVKCFGTTVGGLLPVGFKETTITYIKFVSNIVENVHYLYSLHQITQIYGFTGYCVR